MGLCKCPKKKVTNLFCFEHRVNVCEHCLVSNHSRCVVQSYLQWLQDSDYDPNCRLCGKILAGDNGTECVRLMCYDVFHWSCIDNYARRLPSNTAPAGYTCPICKSGLFPANNVASPVADSLRELLAKVNWARAGLGMPLIDEPVQPPHLHSMAAEALPAEAQQEVLSHIPSAAAAAAASHHVHAQSPPYQASPQMAAQAAYSSNAQSVINVGDDGTPYARSMDKTDNPRVMFDSMKSDVLNMTHDHDDDKYKRRPALQWFSRWFKSRSGPQKQDPNATCKRFAVIIILGIIGFLTLIIIFMKLGRASADSDPFLDPMANPQIRINQE